MRLSELISLYVVAFIFIVAHCFYASSAFALPKDQVQEKNPVAFIEVNPPVMHRVLKCNLEAEGRFVEFFSSVSVEREAMTNEQANQKSEQCYRVVGHEFLEIFIWFIAGVAIGSGFPYLNASKRGGK